MFLVGSHRSFVLVELMTVGLTSIWFAAGSFVAFIIAPLGGNVVVQGIAFILVSVVLLALKAMGQSTSIPGQ